jgi:hypothetical protein
MHKSTGDDNGLVLMIFKLSDLSNKQVASSNCEQTNKVDTQG